MIPCLLFHDLWDPHFKTKLACNYIPRYCKTDKSYLQDVSRCNVVTKMCIYVYVYITIYIHILQQKAIPNNLPLHLRHPSPRVLQPIDLFRSGYRTSVTMHSASEASTSRRDDVVEGGGGTAHSSGSGWTTEGKIAVKHIVK